MCGVVVVWCEGVGRGYFGDLIGGFLFGVRCFLVWRGVRGFFIFGIVSSRGFLFVRGTGMGWWIGPVMGRREGRGFRMVGFV